MPPSIIGSRLPDWMYERVHDRTHAVRHHRICGKCGYGYPTAEVALLQAWSGGRAWNCPVHQQSRGRCLSQLGVRQAKLGKYYSRGLKRVVEWGGYYRRRECEALVAVELGVRKRCGVRWTTAEVSSDGTVVEDIKPCPRCGDWYTKIRPTDFPDPWYGPGCKEGL